MNIDTLYDEFKSIADNSVIKLEEMLAVISDGRIPAIADCKELDSVIMQLCDKYESVKSLAKKELVEDEIPADGSPFLAFCDAIKNSKSAILKKRIKEIEKILVRFISVQSLITKYATALMPFQNEAKELLFKINSGDISDIEEISKESSAPELFMNAMECEDLNSDEGIDMLDGLLEQYGYPVHVTLGLSSKNYFVPDAIDEEAVKHDCLPNRMTNCDEDITKPKHSETNDESIQKVVQNENIVETDNGNSDTENPQEESTEFRKALGEKGLVLENGMFGVLSKEINVSETKKISSSIFINDLRKGNVKVLKTIIKQLDGFALISPTLLTLRSTFSEDTANINLDFLLRKGYLRKYRITPGGEFYCSSPKLQKALCYKDAAKFVELKQLHSEDLLEFIEDTASSGSARAALINLYTNIETFNNKSGVKQTNTTGILMTEAFGYIITDTVNPNDAVIITGAFFTNYAEVDFYPGLMDILTKRDISANSFVFAAINKEIARKYMDMIIELFPGKINTERVFLYATDIDKYFSYISDENIIIDQIMEHQEFEDNDDTYDEVNQEEKATIDSKNEAEKIVETLDTNANAETITNDEISNTIISPSISQDHNEVIYQFFIGEKYYCAPVYTRSLMMRDSYWNEMYDRIAYAVNDPMKHCMYSADNVFDLIPSIHTAFSDDLMVAIGIRTFFSNQVRYDFDIKAYYNAIKDFSVLNECPSLGNVLYKLADFKDTQKKGMDAYADYHAKSVAELDNEIKKVQQEAKVFYESTILARKQEKASQRRFLETKKLLFDVDGDIGQYIKMIVDDDKDMQSLVVDFIQQNFIKEGNALAEDTIDSDMLWNFILKYWNEAGEKMMMKLRVDLMSHLRSNIVNITSKALQIMVRWCNLVNKYNDQDEDTGSIAYKKVRKALLGDINDALIEITKTINDVDATDNKAGLSVIRYALNDILRCIDGTYEENERRYFYAPFLFTDDILLDENFCPDLDVHCAEVAELQPEYRIIEHSKKIIDDPITRLNSILEDGDDLGTAKLIIEYLRFKGSHDDLEEYLHSIDASEEYAKETAELKKEQFIGELELAQSYGRIDNSNSSEDKKEKILQVIDAWYEKTIANSNYGFFARVMESYLVDIKRQSKTREKDLLEQLDTFKNASIKGIKTEIKDKKIAQILAAIDQQNYTVAEDLLAHSDQMDDMHDVVIEENFLRDFLDNFNDYYKNVAMSQMSFATLVSSKTRNKEERGGKRLADNWLPGGSKLGKNRLIALLNGFGFRVDSNSVQEQDQIVRFESYNVRTIKATNGKREIYTHPIAAFGSGASEEGFRVVCINGKYDAAGLINLMEQIGNAKHTMILLDCALDRAERRILAKKSKCELGDKLFVVIDRTVMMYMVKNYDETKANRMLMAIIVPFGYYQPYVWESSNVMPPEIFMGRKHELERIETPTGVNIVYGGRQLGKSALLKKAKADIDRDENCDRAVLVDIKGLDYKNAAKKIGHALYDEGILQEDIDTTDWADLSRVIRKRLQLNDDRIQYLLLLLDEADAFIESCEEINYQPFDALKEIQGIGAGRFKFVIAGLRNIVRFKRDAALGYNSVLTHLEAMTVKPFKLAEARELMEIPLHYLGLEFPKENESLMTLILATTNYFPGLIQMYCAKLLTAMRNKDYAGYGMDTPVYEISEEHIKKVLTDSEFTDQIREKFFITLKLDEDNYYYLIALIMAYLYYTNGYNEGYSSQDIKNAGNTLDISKIATLDDDKLVAFMEELKELNVLRSTNDTCYLFSKFSFFQMMGTRIEVDDKLVEYMED